MASDVDIANMALGIVGSDTTITSMSPPSGSAAARHCALYYDTARREALTKAHWSFARKRATLATLTNPSTVWTYAYALPSDCIAPVRIPRLSSAIMDGEVAVDWNWLVNESGGADYIVEYDGTQAVLLTNEADAELFYIFDQTNAAKYTPMFVTGLAYLLASYLAGPIIRGKPGIATAKDMRVFAEATLQQAASIEGNGNLSMRSDNWVSDAIQARQ